METLTDIYGNFRAVPEQIIEERHNGDFIKISIYKNESGFYYGYQIKIAAMVKQKTANIKEKTYRSADAACMYAVLEIERICMAHRTVRKVYVNFTKIRHSQRELFDNI
jgi:hypothetical protein